MAATRPPSGWLQRSVVQQAPLPPPPLPSSRRQRAVQRSSSAPAQEANTAGKAAPPSQSNKSSNNNGKGSSAAAAAAAPVDTSGQRAMIEAAERESLQLLEWPALCRQVACFARTPMGAEVALRCALPVGRTRQESEQLLAETAEAQQALLEFKGTFDLRRAVDAAQQQQRVLHPMVLGAVATTLATAANLQARLRQGARPEAQQAQQQEQGKQQGQGQQQQQQGQQQQQRGEFSALLQLASGIGDALPGLQQAIEQCIQPQEGRILDSASPVLAEVREARRVNRTELRAEMDRWARQLHAAGVSERPQVVVRRDRLCIPVKSGRQGELPKGSVSLATSATGNTLYMEPAPAVGMNNAEMVLAGREQEEETEVLVALSGMVAQHAQQLRSVLSSITALDVASARARHATWLGATAPPTFLSAEEATERSPVHLPRAWHPLLLQPCLPPLPPLPLTEEMQQQLESQGMQSAQLQELSLVPELAAAAAPKPVGEVGSSLPKRGSKGSSSSSSEGEGDGSSVKKATPPRPLDMVVPPGVSVVAVTGPNTGGKTASLKALGLQCLMAKAGLFLPQAPLEGQQGQQPQALLWFDRVLADLGDGQSLQQSLSTFSGHVRRIRNVLAAATSESLVLLDEVGSGTDPAEGAALAAALLERLQRQAALTYATTHHAELKELASSTPGFVNASVEFDVASLRPTYRLMWGAAGESNALAVAEGLGFAPAIVTAAREVAEQLHHSSQTSSQRSQLLQASLVGQLEEARQVASEVAATRAAAEAAAAAAQQELEAAKEQGEIVAKAAKAAKGAGAAAQQRVQRVMADVKAGRLGAREAEEKLREMEAEVAPPEAAAMRLMGLRAAAKGDGLAEDWESSDSGSDSEGGWVASQGEMVQVLKMGGATGKVVSSSGRSGGKVSVRVGALTVELRMSDVAPASGMAVQRHAAAAGARSSSTGPRRGGSMKSAAQQLRAHGSMSSSDDEDAAAAGTAVAFQTSLNTVDVRGMASSDAAAEVQAAVLSASPGWVLFVVHGVGRGLVRAAVLQQLKRMPQVKKTEEEEGSKGGCTMVWVK